MESAFHSARDFLLAHRTDYERAYRDFEWPKLDRFNWAFDHFDRIPAKGRVALHVVKDDLSEEKLTFAELTARSNQVARFFQRLGVKRGDRVLLMLPNRVELWEVMLACMKLGAVIIPATTQLVVADILDRVERGKARTIVVDDAGAEKLEAMTRGSLDGVRLITVGAPREGFASYADAATEEASFASDGETRASDPLLLYFTSGTTAKPKLVLHTHASYPVGHLSTMYWMGLKPGDVHWNISSPGWAKHAWSNVFAPWNAEATVLVFDAARFSATRSLSLLEREKVTSLCAPPTVWRMFILEDLTKTKQHLREIVSAGEPLNPEIIERVKDAWGIPIRDGYGQTETTAQVGNPPGARIKLGSMGRPLPGYRVVLLDPDDRACDEGELSLPLEGRPMGLMDGYQSEAGEDSLMEHATRAGHYRTGDVVERDADGYLTYVGRSDDVFKASDYRISPFELESALIEHASVAEAAVVPSPDPVRLAVPKAFVVLRPGFEPTSETAHSIFAFLKEKLPPFKRVRKLEFVGAFEAAKDFLRELPKTISGKIRRVELRRIEVERQKAGVRGAFEHGHESG
jgi:acetyl-CoA synthetase